MEIREDKKNVAEFVKTFLNVFLEICVDVQLVPLFLFNKFSDKTIRLFWYVLLGKVVATVDDFKF